MLEQGVVDAAIAFCEDSMVIQEVLDPVTTVANVAEYTLDAPSYNQVERILALTYNGSSIALIASDAAPAPSTTTGTPTAAYTKRVDGELLLVLVPTPDAAGVISAKAAIRPVRGAQYLHNDLFELWIDTVLTGAYSRLAAVPGQPFFDPLLANQAAGRFISMSRQARVRGTYGAVRASRQVTPRPFA